MASPSAGAHRDQSVPSGLGSAKHSSTSTSKKLHIALVIRTLNKRSGGAERLYCELANMLSDAGYRVSCLYFDNAPGEPFYPLSPDVTLINLAPEGGRSSATDKIKRRLYRVASKFLKTGAVNRLAWSLAHGPFQTRLATFFRAEQPDVAISFLPPANTPTLRAAQGTNVRVVPTNHNVPAEDYASPARWDPNPYDRKLRLENLEFASAIHVLFPSFKAWFPKHLQARIVAIPNYVSRNFLDAQPKPMRQKVVLAVGRLAPVKNYGALIEAWSGLAPRFPEWRLDIYGVGPDRSRLLSKISDLGLTGRVHLKGHTAGLEAVYAESEIFCHPALFEGFGLSVAEALALRLPVIAFSDCAGVNEYVVDGHNGLLVSRTEGALARGLEQLIEDEALRARLGDNGPASILQFSEQAYLETWIKTIERVAAHAHGS